MHGPPAVASVLGIARNKLRMSRRRRRIEARARRRLGYEPGPSLDRALAVMPTAVRQYTNCVAVLTRARRHAR
jgi:hypothetical protein